MKTDHGRLEENGGKWQNKGGEAQSSIATGALSLSAHFVAKSTRRIAALKHNLAMLAGTYTEPCSTRCSTDF